MRTAKATKGVAFLATGFLAVAVGIPETLSGAGGVSRIFANPYCPTCQITAPEGAIALRLGPGIIFLEPAFLVGVALLILGVHLLRKGLTTWLKMDKRIGSRPDLR